MKPAAVPRGLRSANHLRRSAHLLNKPFAGRDKSPTKTVKLGSGFDRSTTATHVSEASSYPLPYGRVSILLATPPPQLAKRPPVNRLARPMLTHATIVSCPTADTPGAGLVLTCDTRSYYFGHVAEGSQRSMNERKVTLGRLEDVLLTGPVGYRNCGGLMGLILTVAGIVQSATADAKAAAALGLARQKKKAGRVPLSSSAMRLYAGDNLAYFLAVGRRFILRQAMPVIPIETIADPRMADRTNIEPDREDEFIRVWNVPLDPNATLLQPSNKRRRRAGSEEKGDGEGDDAQSPARAASRSRGPMTEADRNLVNAVVSDMFESEWKLDALIETTLHQVKLPATIFVRNPDRKLEKYTGPLPNGRDDVPDIPVLVRKPWPGSQVPDLPRTSPSQTSMCYIVHTQARRGRFLPQVALSLGVKRKLFNILTSGESLVTEAGNTVTPEMVMEPRIPGVGFAIVDIPSADFVDAFLARPEWSHASIADPIKAMYWILGPGLTRDERLLDFMRQRPALRHTVFSEDECPNELALQGSAANTIKHNQIDPARFPLPAFNNGVAARDGDQWQTRPFQHAQAGAKLQLAPAISFHDDKAEAPMDTMAAAADLADDVVALADEARARVASPEFRARVGRSNVGLPCPDAEVLALGTGSSLPSKHRNVSATLVRVPGSGSYLFDCGEGTLGQLRRHYGPEAAKEVLRDLRAIFISHLHADHHLGTVSVLRAWDAATADDAAAPRLALVSSNVVLTYFHEYEQIERLSDRLDFTKITIPTHGRTCDPIVFSPAQAARLGGLTHIECCTVPHCYAALATSFTWAGTGLKVAYSGDCRPSMDFAAMARGATLLIHESTFDDDKADQALAKKHSTMGEALGVARAMRARRVLLTHFSQRYPKIAGDSSASASASAPAPEGGDQDHVDMEVLVAFDHMRVRLGDFVEAAEFLPALRRLYDEDTGADEDDEVQLALAQGVTDGLPEVAAPVAA